MSLPALQPPCPSADSSARILNEASGVEPGWVEIMPRAVTDHVRTWLLSAQTGEPEGSSRSGPGRGNGHCLTFLSPEMISFPRSWDPSPSEFFPFFILSSQNSRVTNLLALPPSRIPEADLCLSLPTDPNPPPPQSCLPHLLSGPLEQLSPWPLPAR